MISSLNLIKSVNKYEKEIAKKCKWINADNIPVRKSLIPEGFVGKAQLEPHVPVIGTKLNPNNITVMEIITGDSRISRNKFVKANLTEILDMAKTQEGSKMVQKILTVENLDKLDTIRNCVKNYPRDYVKDRTQAKYINTPAGLNALFNNVSMLKASAIMDVEHLNKLFKMDITCSKGKEVLDSIGNMDLAQIEHAQKSLKPSKNINLIS